MNILERMGLKRAPEVFDRKPGFALRLGTDAKGREAFLSDSEIRQHMLVLGTTGAGKTEFLLSLLDGALSRDAGAIYVDGKGDPTLAHRIRDIAAAHGRERDLLVLNFMTLDGSARAVGTNTFNPFAFGPADWMTQVIVDFMDPAGGDGSMWKGRATAMMTALLRALVWLRDERGFRLDAASIRDASNLRRMIELADPAAHPEMPEPIRKSLRSYLTSLPGFREDKGYRQAQTTLDQHGYLEMQFTRILGSLADVYGHVFCTDTSDVDMREVVADRRILLVMLPTLEKSADEVGFLGKLVVASLKAMMASRLGASIEGDWSTVLETRQPTRAPFLCILDEVQGYVVSGMALLAAQARSLGFGMVFCSQNLESLSRAGSVEASSIVGNTSTKVLMALESADAFGSTLAEGRVPKLSTLRPGEFVAFRGNAFRRLRSILVQPKRAERDRTFRLNRPAVSRATAARPATESSRPPEPVDPDAAAERLAAIRLPPLPVGFELAARDGYVPSCDDASAAALRTVARAAEDDAMLDLATAEEVSR